MAQTSSTPLIRRLFRPPTVRPENTVTSTPPPPKTESDTSKKLIRSSVDFFGSQIGDQTVINYSYTDRPLRLLAWDIYYFFRFSWAIPYVLWPFRPFDSGHMSELAPTWGNAWCILVHLVLVVLQLAFLLCFPPVALFMPLWMTLAGVAAFMALNKALCLMINGEEEVFHSDPEYARPGQERFAHEQWIFLNGVAAGEHWMRNNLNRLALTFGRPVIGIHNKTDGILFDVVECLVQRNFTYATNDVRVCYRIIKEKLYNPRYSKVVFILHSQGGIEGGLVLDWLLQELPQNLLCKLEVYTFGNAANHFNNPYRTVSSQDNAEARPLAASLDALRSSSQETSSSTEKSGAKRTNGDAVGTHQPLRNRNRNRRPPTPTSPPPPPLRTNTSALEQQKTNNPPPFGTTTGTTTTESPTAHTAAAAHAASPPPPPPTQSERAIGHIEHYAHTTDFVALWGVLHFATSATADRSMPRFIGRLFSRTCPDGRGGHQFVQHYLDGMFPLQRDSVTGRLVGCRETGNEFMESDVVLGKVGDEGSCVREAFACSYLGCLEDELGDDGDGDDGGKGGKGGGGGVAMHNGESPIALRTRMGLPVGKVQVKELSRLWKYRNGRSPVEKPPLLGRGMDGFVRNATLSKNSNHSSPSSAAAPPPPTTGTTSLYWTPFFRTTRCLTSSGSRTSTAIWTPQDSGVSLWTGAGQQGQVFLVAIMHALDPSHRPARHRDRRRCAPGHHAVLARRPARVAVPAEFRPDRVVHVVLQAGAAAAAGVAVVVVEDEPRPDGAQAAPAACAAAVATAAAAAVAVACAVDGSVAPVVLVLAGPAAASLLDVLVEGRVAGVVDADLCLPVGGGDDAPAATGGGEVGSLVVVVVGLVGLVGLVLVGPDGICVCGWYEVSTFMSADDELDRLWSPFFSFTVLTSLFRLKSRRPPILMKEEPRALVPVGLGSGDAVVGAGELMLIAFPRGSSPATQSA
ncbi:hypothetical protein VMCG_06142 [Cytospora schulzeri]|uniref:DUF676 domain-containing protein n=1 Tax=Cytospora schulzeri TaxID=448051 RepID=A0A423WGH7_9PEZI|nr:hypothetical protein VMCG_06142 [Valsa malicola]